MSLPLHWQKEIEKTSIEQHAATSQCTTAAKRHMIVSNAARKTAPKMHTEKYSTMNTKALRITTEEQHTTQATENTNIHNTCAIESNPGALC